MTFQLPPPAAWGLQPGLITPPKVKIGFPLPFLMVPPPVSQQLEELVSPPPPPPPGPVTQAGFSSRKLFVTISEVAVNELGSGTKVVPSGKVSGTTKST